MKRSAAAPGSGAHRITIHDVAREAGVSIATVSRVVSGNPQVNAEMVGLVRTAAEKLGYSPNSAAQGLASGQYRSIGVVVPDLGNPYFNDILKSTVTAAAAERYRMVVSDSGGDPEEEFNACQQQLSQVDGLLVLSSRMPVERLHALAGQQVPVVLVNRVELGVALPMVAADNFSAMLELCQHLRDLGHTKVAYLAGSPLAWQNRERWRGVQQARIMGMEASLIQADATISAGYAATDEALAAGPTAILAYNDLAAIGVMARLRELGLRVPHDISVTGFDDIEVAQHATPPLTTATSPKAELGRLAWELLRAGLNGERAPLPPLLPAEVVLRSSTGRARPPRG
ncbi:MAG TPA: LacI family DNA-binding transcriptional regulator [Intrasporangium sp.]|uniref:LacI family DNA-binding transcriptional regulator n=1 Tax=Intrasporangium sp. TaxID=1925024 RepID=UPI002D78A86D|nr:LacI family DNA-binding transcriptional regulator [Intrasporangium sp.]HET7398249.1 LacI family DNA-binding transcriptional regulator [Intrasporangium sp.]